MTAGTCSGDRDDRPDDQEQWTRQVVPVQGPRAAEAAADGGRGSRRTGQRRHEHLLDGRRRRGREPGLRRDRLMRGPSRGRPRADPRRGGAQPGSTTHKPMPAPTTHTTPHGAGATCARGGRGAARGPRRQAHTTSRPDRTGAPARGPSAPPHAVGRGGGAAPGDTRTPLHARDGRRRINARGRVRQALERSSDGLRVRV